VANKLFVKRHPIDLFVVALQTGLATPTKNVFNMNAKWTMTVRLVKNVRTMNVKILA
jgi:hypothetical protein